MDDLKSNGRLDRADDGLVTSSTSAAKTTNVMHPFFFHGSDAPCLQAHHHPGTADIFDNKDIR